MLLLLEQVDARFLVVQLLHVLGGLEQIVHNQYVEDDEEREGHKRVDAGVYPRPDLLHEEVVGVAGRLAAGDGVVDVDACDQRVREHKVRVDGEHHDCQRHGGRLGLVHRAQATRLERECDGDEALDGHDDHHPDAEVERGVEGDARELAGHVGHDGDRLAGVEEDPEVEAAVDEHHLVGDGQHGHVEVGRLVAHLLASHHQKDEYVADGADGEYERKRDELDDVIVARRDEVLVLVRARSIRRRARVCRPTDRQR